MLPIDLIKSLDTENEQLRDEIAALLATMGQKIVELLIRVLIEIRSKNRQLGVIDALGRIGDIEAIEPIVFTIIIDPIWLFESNAIRALIKIGEKTNYETVVKYFCKELNYELNNSAGYRTRIIRNLGYLIRHAMFSPKNLGEIKKYTYILINELSSEFREARFAAASALFDVKFISPIIKILHYYKDKEIRRDAALMLKNIAYEIISLNKGKDDIRKIKRALKRAYYDDDKDVRKTAKESLKSIGNAVQLESDSRIKRDRIRAAFSKIFKDLIITEEDCGCTRGIFISDIIQKGDVIKSLKKRIVGRYTNTDVEWQKTCKIFIKKGEFITKNAANELEKAGKEVFEIRSVLHCRAKKGICLKCFGRYNFAGDVARVGEKIGNKAASWWARMKLNKRLIDLLEARIPKNASIICESDGSIGIDENKYGKITISIIGANNYEKKYSIPRNIMSIVDDCDEVYRGQELIDGIPDPNDIIKIKGDNKLVEYIINELLHYMPRSNFDERLVELFVRQTTRIKVKEPGGSEFKKDKLLSMKEYKNENVRLAAAGKRIITGPLFFTGIRFI